MKAVKIILTLGTAACIGLFFSVAGQASSKKAAENSLVGSTGSYGATLTKIIAADSPMFSHQVHVIDLALECSSCHTDTFEKKRGAAVAAGDYTMKALEEGKYCGTCHNDDDAFGVADPDTCASCHGSDMKQPKVVVFEKPAKGVIFDHAMHTDDLDLKCNGCHNDLFKMKTGTAEEHPKEFTMEALYKGKYCGACHNGTLAFESGTRCTACHIGVKGYKRMFGVKDSGHGGHGDAAKKVDAHGNKGH